MATSADNAAVASPVEVFYSYSHKDEEQDERVAERSPLAA
jgi:hypothetical protein